MYSTVKKQEWSKEIRYFGPAQVVAFDEKESLCRIRLSCIDDPPEGIWAASAIPGSYEWLPGDCVLCAGESLSGMYIIGVLKPKDAKISVKTGAYATTSGSLLQVFSNEKKLMFEYDAQNNRARINVPSGDLEIASQGDINFTAGKNIQLQGQHLEMKGSNGMRIGLTDAIGRLSDAITLMPGRIRLKGNELNVKVRRGTINVEETRIIGKRLKSIFDRVDLIAGTVETISNTVIEKAKNTYRSAEQLSQLTTGRLKTLVKETIHLKSKRAFLHSEDDFKINADKIHLG